MGGCGGNQPEGPVVKIFLSPAPWPSLSVFILLFIRKSSLKTHFTGGQAQTLHVFSFSFQPAFVRRTSASIYDLTHFLSL